MNDQQVLRQVQRHDFQLQVEVVNADPHQPVWCPSSLTRDGSAAFITWMAWGLPDPVPASGLAEPHLHHASMRHTIPRDNTRLCRCEGDSRLAVRYRLGTLRTTSLTARS
jgi:hypothetical protein